MRRTLVLLLLLTSILGLSACGGDETTAATTSGSEPLPLPADVATVGTAVIAPPETGTLVPATDTAATLGKWTSRSICGCSQFG